MTIEETLKQLRMLYEAGRVSADQILDRIPELAESEDESEDERIRKHLVAIVEMYWGKTNDPDKAKDLAYLEKQKEQKPAEWSEEDEKMREKTISKLELAYPYALHDQNPARDCLDWLKSLHSWRPSEEQMEALKEASASWMNEKMGNAKLLQSLYEQLRAL